MTELPKVRHAQPLGVAVRSATTNVWGVNQRSPDPSDPSDPSDSTGSSASSESSGSPEASGTPGLSDSPEAFVDLQAIRSAFPTLSWESAQWIDEGWDYIAVICRGCSGDDALGHQDLVFRFPVDEHAHARLPYEAEILNYVATQVDAAIPQYSHASNNSRLMQFAGYPLVRGDRLTPELLHSLPGTERTEVTAQVGALLSSLHAMDTTAPALEPVPESFQPENLDFIRRIMVSEMPDLLTADEMRTARDICHEVAALQAADLPVVFLHNDVHMRHFYWERPASAEAARTSPLEETAAPARAAAIDQVAAPEEIPAPNLAAGRLGLIDFSDMCLGDPAVDFAELYEYGPRFVDEVLAHYVGRIDESFLDRAWTYQRLAGLYMIAGHLFYGEETWEHARATFDRCRSPHRPRA